jgi:hypothetical protein
MEQHLNWIGYYALLFGSAYFLLDYPFDIFFVKKIAQKPWTNSLLLSFAVHALSTFTAFYALPVLVLAVTKSDQAWFRIGLFSAGTGLSTSLPEYLCLRLLLKKPISVRNLSFLFWNKLSVFWLSVALVMLLGFSHSHSQ